MRVARATPDDAEAIHALRMAVFAQVALDYADPELPPLRETVEEVRAEPTTHVVLKAVEDGRIVGSVRGRLEDVVCHVERLVVHPEARGRGVGTLLTTEIERAFPEAERFELFTGDRSARSLHIYSKLGYREYRRVAEKDYALVYLAKPGPAD
jgi:ribosomal protein S18 acetylase RimI-like enzyme